MRLTVLGGSHAAVNTGAGSSGYLVSHRDTNILVDPGPNTITELRKHADHRRLTGVVISHLHADHILDVITLRLAIRYNPIKSGHVTPIHVPPGGEAMFRSIVEPMRAQDGYDDFFEDFTFHEYDPSRPLHLGDLEIRFAPTLHAIPGWAMRFEADDDSRALVFTSDTGPNADLDEFATDAWVLLSEATYGVDPMLEQRRDIRFHMTAGEAIAFANRARAHQLVLTHTAEEKDPEAVITALREGFDGSACLAHPGLIVDWPESV